MMLNIECMKISAAAFVVLIAVSCSSSKEAVQTDGIPKREVTVTFQPRFLAAHDVEYYSSCAKISTDAELEREIAAYKLLAKDHRDRADRLTFLADPPTDQSETIRNDYLQQAGIMDQISTVYQNELNRRRGIDGTKN